MSEQLVWIGCEVFGGRVVSIKKDAVGVETDSGLAYYTFDQVEKELGV